MCANNAQAIQVAGGSDKGLVRPQNEDSILYCQFEHSDVSLLVVADGVGGYSGGAEASQLAIQVMEQTISKAVLQANSGGGFGEHWLESNLHNAIAEANHKILLKQKEVSDLSQMSSTVVALLVNRDEAALCHLGDSRCYEFTDNTLTQIMVDHTMLQDMLSEGKIDQQTFELLPMHHVISQAMGLTEEPDIKIDLFKLKQNARYLLCSDGLTDCVSDAQIEHVLTQCAELDDCVDELITQANDNGGTDNISVVIANYS